MRLEFSAADAMMEGLSLHYLIGSYSAASEDAACGDLRQDFLGGLSELLRRYCLAYLLCQSADHDHGTGVL